MITEVVLTKKALRGLQTVPHFILDNFQIWVKSILEIGIEEVRKIPGYHDEPLQGKRKGFRSVRLNRSYRVIYKMSGSHIELVEVCEVNKHEY